MAYYFHTTLRDISFEEAIEKVTEVLKTEGFGVLSDIDVSATLKKKIDVDFKRYRILGACNPGFAHKALTAEEMVGVFLPCNVVVIEQPDGSVDVSAVDPIASMASVDNPSLGTLAKEVQAKMKKVIEQL